MFQGSHALQVQVPRGSGKQTATWMTFRHELTMHFGLPKTWLKVSWPIIHLVHSRLSNSRAHLNFLAGFNCFLIRLSPLNRYREKPHKKIPCLDLRPLLLSCLFGQFYNPHFLSCSIFLLGIRCCCSPIHWYHYQRLSTNKELKIWARDNVINSILKGKIIGNSRSNDTDQNLRRRALEISPFKSLKLAPIEQNFQESNSSSSYRFDGLLC